jgi:uncharacterized protein (TIGR03086 family)
VPVLGGKTIDEVGSVYEGDNLGDDPVGAFDAAADAALAAVDDLGSLDDVVHLSFGDAPAREYLSQLFADHLIHGWDLARAIGAQGRLEPDLVDACATWYAEREAEYRKYGVVGPQILVAPGADAQEQLLARFGRGETLWAVMRFNDAFARHDADAVMACMTDDCVFEGTDPAPDGQRHEGQEAVGAYWRKFFEANPQAAFTTEEAVVAGDRATLRWRYDWGDGHVRGVDVMRIREGLVAEKLSYVKG